MKFTVQFADIIERDTDFAIIHSFIEYEIVRNLFFSQINKKGEIIKIYHSKAQAESDGHIGESDIIFVLKNKNEKFAIFIEDKIAADPQPFQRKRYDDRAELLSKEEEYNGFFVFLCAPKAYLKTEKAKGYNFFVSHEDICNLLNENDLNKHIFNFSCDEKKQCYCPIKNEPVTEFWIKLYPFIKENYPQLTIKESVKPRGKNATWPEFTTCVKGLRIFWKSDIKRNCIDLTFSGLEKDKNTFRKIVKSVGATKYEPVVTSKSMALRISLPTNKLVLFSDSFEKQIDNINYCLKVVAEFNEVAKQIFYLGIDKVPIQNK